MKSWYPSLGMTGILAVIDSLHSVRFVTAVGVALPLRQIIPMRHHCPVLRNGVGKLKQNLSAAREQISV